MRTVFSPNSWRHLIVVVLPVSAVLAISGCSFTTNNGDCDAQGASNGVRCVQQTNPPRPHASHKHHHLTGSASQGAGSPEAPGPNGSQDPQPAEPRPTHATYRGVQLEPVCLSTDCSGTQQVGGNVFSYTDEAEADDYPRYWEHLAFQEAASSCKELLVRFSGDEWMQNDARPPVGYLKFIQQSDPPVYATVTAGKIVTVRVPLDGGPLYIDASVTDDGGVHNNYILLKVTGVCSTPDGVR